MITPFGKELRKIRLDRDLLLKNMADDFDFSSSYLSAIENGKKEIPKDFIKKLRANYNLSEEEFSKLEIAKIESQKSIEFNISELNKIQQDFMFSFARRFEEIPEEKLKKIMKDIEDD